jgi:hypothetical protein
MSVVGGQFTEPAYDFLVFALHEDEFAVSELSKRSARPHVFERLLNGRVFRGVAQLSPDRWVFDFGRYGIVFQHGQARIVLGNRNVQDIAADETCDVDEQLRDYALGA